MHWTQTMRAVNWSFKRCLNNLSSMTAPCMDPVYIGIQPDEIIRENLEKLRACGLDTLLIEGLRRLMLYEKLGISAQVRADIAHAVELAHEYGMKVIYHSTCTFAEPNLDDFSAQDRAMLAIDGRTGKEAYIEGWDGWFLWCFNNPDFREKYYHLTRAMVKETKVDGLMTDEVNFRASAYQCVCPHCLAQFGGPMPEVDYENPRWLDWLRFRLRSTGDFYEGLRRAIDFLPLLGCKNDEPNSLQSQVYGDNNDERMRGTSILFTEICTRDLRKKMHVEAINCAAYQGLKNYWDVPCFIFGIVDSHHVDFLYGMQVSHAGRPWICGRALMERSLSPEDNLTDNDEDMVAWKKNFDWENQYRELLAQSTRPAAKIALLLSAATRDLYKGEINDVTEETFQDGGFVAEFHGWSRALSENHLPYAVITEYELTPERLNAFDVLILPHAVCLPDLDFEKISCRILATGDTGLRGLDGMKRAKPLFASRLPLQQFDVQELLTLKHPLQVTNAPSSLLVRPVVSPDGMLVHLVTGSDVFEQEQWIFKAEGMTEGYLTSPSRPEAQPLRITDGEFYISPETIGQYALLILKR